MSPMNHVGRRLLSPIFIPNIGHNQSASRIIALTFLIKNVSNESAFFVQRAHPYRAFLRNRTRTIFRVPTALTVPTGPRVPTAHTVLTGPRVPTALTVSTALTVLTVPTAPIATTSTTASTPSGGQTLLVSITNEQSESRGLAILLFGRLCSVCSVKVGSE